jgi:hypothetical protein
MEYSRSLKLDLKNEGSQKKICAFCIGHPSLVHDWRRGDDDKHNRQDYDATSMNDDAIMELNF